jgi:hypothetical protein
MIVSHRHRFIFVKTAKTAGTAIEQALLHFCGPDDVFAGWQGGEGTNARRGLGRIGIYVPGEIRRRFPRLYGFEQHSPARHIRALVGPEVWNSYFKFSIERNPWDRRCRCSTIGIGAVRRRLSKGT